MRMTTKVMSRRRPHRSHERLLGYIKKLQAAAAARRPSVCSTPSRKEAAVEAVAGAGAGAEGE